MTPPKQRATIQERRSMTARLSEHIWSIIVSQPDAKGTAHPSLLCDGELHPRSGPNYSIDLRYDRGHWLKDGPYMVKALHTSFDPDMCTTLAYEVPMEEPVKRLSGVEWWSEQKPGTKLWLLALYEGVAYPDSIESYWMTSKYLHGLGELEGIINHNMEGECNE